MIKKYIIFLKGINGQYAWFCVNDNMVKDLDVFNPFIWISKFIYTEDFIIVPIWALIKLSHGLEPDVIMSLFPSELTVGFFYLLFFRSVIN